MTTPSPPIPRVTSRPSPVIDDRSLTVTLADMPRMPDGHGREYVPNTAVISYYREGAKPWRVRARMIGPRVMSTGVLSSRSKASRTYFDDDEMDPRYPSRQPIPAVLHQTIADYHPDNDGKGADGG